MNHKKITLDTERKSFESIIAMQGDNKSRYIEATIVNRSIPVDLTGCTVKFSAIKPDITDIFNNAVITNPTAGKVEIELTNQTLAVPGVIQATLVILKEDMQLSVLPFFITVIENPYNPNAIESKPEYQALNNALIVADGYAKELQDASVNLEEKYTTRLNNFGSQLEHKTNYLTPEMFGEVTDDCTEIIQKCIDTAIRDDIKTILLTKEYKTKSPVIFTGYYFSVIGNGSIIYTGEDYAIHIYGCVNCNITLNRIHAENGGGILFKGDSSKFNQYINFYIGEIKAKTNCAYYNHINNGSWTNEIKFYNPRLSTINYTSELNTCGVKIDSDASDYVNGWKLICPAFENINYGVYLNDTNGTKDNAIEFEIISPRTSENFDYIVKTNGYVNFNLSSANKYIKISNFSLSNKTSGIIQAKLVADDYTTISNTGIIDNGLILPSGNLISNSWSLVANANFTVGEDVKTFINHFNIKGDLKFNIKLNKFYCAKGVDKFDLDIQANNSSVIIKAYDDSTLVEINNLQPNAIYHFYFKNGDKDLYYYITYKTGVGYKETLLSDPSITLENCTNPGYYTHNGYKEMGALKVVNICVMPTSASFTIKGLPAYNSNGITTAVSSNNGKGYIKADGTISIFGATPSQETYISVTYFA